MIERAARDIANSRYAIALTGAGISTDSGIPDFRGPSGIWTKNPEAERKAYEVYYKFLQDPKRYWEERLTGTPILGNIREAKPNAGHYALTELERIGVLKCVLTQNIDGLHEKAGNKRVVEYHGSVFKLRCLSCGWRCRREEYDLEALLADNKLPPLCKECNAPVKDDVVHFNEPIPTDVAEESVREVQMCDLMLICGTSAVVYPFAQLPRLARYGGGGLREPILYYPERKSSVVIIEVNAEPTPLTIEGISDYQIHGNTSEILPLIVERVKELRG